MAGEVKQQKMQLRRKKNIYEQIVDEYTKYISTGALRAGEALPSCRQLAAKLGINPNTVQRAWSELEKCGLIVAVPKKGVFVASLSADANGKAQRHAKEEQPENTFAENNMRHGSAEQCKRMPAEEAAEQLARWRNAGLSKAELYAIAEQIYSESEGKT